MAKSIVLSGLTTGYQIGFVAAHLKKEKKKKKTLGKKVKNLKVSSSSEIPRFSFKRGCDLISIG